MNESYFTLYIDLLLNVESVRYRASGQPRPPGERFESFLLNCTKVSLYDACVKQITMWDKTTGTNRMQSPALGVTAPKRKSWE